MKTFLRSTGWVFLLIFGQLSAPVAKKTEAKTTIPAKTVLEKAQKSPKFEPTSDFDTKTAFVIVGILAQRQRTLPFYNFEVRSLTPYLRAPLADQPLITLNIKTGRFEPKQPLLPLQIMPRLFTVPATTSSAS